MRRYGGVRFITLAVIVLCAVLPSAARAASPPPGFRPFAPDSVWNLRLRADAPVDPASAGYVGWLDDLVARNGLWLNTTSCGMPIFWADGSTPLTSVRLDPSAYQDPALIRAWSAVPMPADARVSNCSDKNFAVAQAQPDGTVREWEFWRAAQAADGSWSARWGGATGDVAADRGIASSLAWQDPTAALTGTTAAQSSFSWNVTATSMSMIAGVVTPQDVAAGHIDHALAFAITDAAKGRIAWPAQRTDGGSSDAYALPEGSRLRIDPRVNLNAIAMVPLVRMIAEAAQKYGIVVRDRTYGVNTFMAQEPQPGQANPYTPLLGGKSADQALKAFPWSRLQLLRGPICTGWGACNATQLATINLSTSTPRAGAPLTLDTSNSTLNQPRAAVAWDLDGNGSYETAGGRGVTTTFVPPTAGSPLVRVRITTRDGSVVTGSRRITIAPAA